MGEIKSRYGGPEALGIGRSPCIPPSSRPAGVKCGIFGVFPRSQAVYEVCQLAPDFPETRYRFRSVGVAIVHRSKSGSAGLGTHRSSREDELDDCLGSAAVDAGTR